jgi:transcriptional regulator of acetoin/glycerol metabolism
MLDACAGNVSDAARRLGIDRRTLYRRLESAKRS